MDFFNTIGQKPTLTMHPGPTLISKFLPVDLTALAKTLATTFQRVIHVLARAAAKPSSDMEREASLLLGKKSPILWFKKVEEAVNFRITKTPNIGRPVKRRSR